MQQLFPLVPNSPFTQVLFPMPNAQCPMPYSLFRNKVIELEIVSFYKNHLRGEEYEKNTRRH
ncbi:hypothetical protein [Nostoc sp. CHAB 5715]|uniref:hypothetical protein n=1 Tax=Nostoc sp. CHAB 5715 TaxID=2780400 RepID=UPI001E43028D|nr:hypothetical protein [Nostoc sp. CHAB 5715]MCC5621114.1 hypothetical protein [Nostoc sp. CHAB 5715]